MRQLFTISAVLMGFLVVGCQTPAQKVERSIDKELLDDPFVLVGVADSKRSQEVAMVEQMGGYRAQYREQLGQLLRFYDAQGNQLKAKWAGEELAHLELGPKRSYVVVAELAGSGLQAGETVADADLLYEEGILLYKQGRGTVGKLLADDQKLYRAIDRFNRIITTYATSDKIDDAAFQIGEIYNHYLKDYTTALLYYERVWQWDPQSDKPAHFAVARIYDEHLHDRTRAVDYYQIAIDLETDYPANQQYARGRIKQLNEEISDLDSN